MKIRALNSAPSRAGFLSAINVALASKDGWTVLRFGVYPNSVGLQVFDRAAAEAIVTSANSLISRAADKFRGLPVYVGHPDDAEWARTHPGVRAEAVGRMPEFRVAEDGLHIRTAFNAEGQRLLSGDAPAYDSFSPNWGMIPTVHQGRKAFRPVELYSIGLTNQPNIPGTWIGLNEALPPEKFQSTHNQTNMNPKLIALLAVLGTTRAADATEEQLISGLNEALLKAQSAVADQAKLATAVNEAATLKTQLTAAQGQVTTAVNEAAGLKTQLATATAARAELVLVTAVNEGRLTAAQKPEWLGKFTAPGADFAAIEAEVGKLKKAVNTKSKADIGARRGDNAQSKTRITAINEAITAKMTAANCDRNTAYVALQSERPELFTNDKTT